MEYRISYTYTVFAHGDEDDSVTKRHWEFEAPNDEVAHQKYQNFLSEKPEVGTRTEHSLVRIDQREKITPLA